MWAAPFNENVREAAARAAVSAAPSCPLVFSPLEVVDISMGRPLFLMALHVANWLSPQQRHEAPRSEDPSPSRLGSPSQREEC